MGLGAGIFLPADTAFNPARVMGIRSDRYDLLVDDGVVKALNREARGKFEVSSAEAMLQAL